MLSEEERMNNAFKELLFQEETMAKKYAHLGQEITDPQLQQMLQGMEQAARAHYGTLAKKMTKMGVV